MNIQVNQKSNLLYVQIDNMYLDFEIEQIKKELNFLETIRDPFNTAEAAFKDGVSLKKGDGIFLDTVYRDRNHSTILKLNRRIFDLDFVEQLSQYSCFFNHIKESTKDTTLINFYGDDGGYETHCDASIFTALTFFSLGKFNGGSLVFTDYDVSIEPVEGRTVIFPGCVLHKAEMASALKGNYRVTMAQFINYTP